MDENVYPEYYRKKADNVKGSNSDTPRPFVIGIIEDIIQSQKNIKITTRLFCRPEDTLRTSLVDSVDLTLVFWTEKGTKLTNMMWVGFIDFFQ